MNSPDKKIQLIKHIIRFADDKRQYVNDWNNNNIFIALKKIHHAAQPWEHILLTTGGKLEIDKCAVFIMTWKFTENGILFILINNNTPPITIQ